MFKKLLTTSILLVTFLLAQPNLTLAETLDTHSVSSINVDTTRLDSGPEIISRILIILTAISIIAFVIFIVYGGVMYLSSFGNEEATTKARKIIFDAVIGLFIVVAAFGIASFILKQFGVDNLGGLENYIKRQ